jgi:hypothetical protein
MKETVKLVLNWIIPVMCIINLVVAWGDTALVLAWMVAAAGWMANLANFYKNDQTEHDYN